MKTREEIIRYCQSFSNVFEDYPFEDKNWTCMRIRKNHRIFAWISEREGYIWVNVKCDPQWRDFWRTAYESVVPAYHMNKEHWNSLILDGEIPEEEVRRMIAESYDLCQGKSSQKNGSRE